MENTYRVAIHYLEDRGYIEYLSDTKTIHIKLAVPEKKAAIEDYFSKEHTIKIPHETLMDFSDTTINPVASLENFKLALTRLWGNTEVYVDWSRPVEA